MQPGMAETSPAQPASPPKRRGPGRPPKSAAGEIAHAKEVFLAALVENGWDTACAMAGVATTTPSRWRKDPEFQARIEALNVDIADRYEKIAEDAILGRRQMDRSAMTLLIFRLKALRPHAYRERMSLEHTGANGGAIKIESGESTQGSRFLAEWGARGRITSTAN